MTHHKKKNRHHGSDVCFSKKSKMQNYARFAVFFFATFFFATFLAAFFFADIKIFYYTNKRVLVIV